MDIQPFIFHVLAFLITLCSLMVVVHRNPVASAVFLVVDLFLLAAMYASLNSHFVAAIQVLVYAGAIVVLFMFVIMLLNLKPEALRGFSFSLLDAFVLVISLAGFGGVAASLLLSKPTAAESQMFTQEAIQQAGGNTFVVGLKLLTTYIWPFELASILILLAIVASVLIAKKDKAALPAAQTGGR